LLLAGCGAALVTGGAVARRPLADGQYVGSARSFPNGATVRVVVKDGRIESVELLAHQGSWVGARAEPVIPARVVEHQSTDVDAVTGATNSSNVIMNAVEDALGKAEEAAGGGGGE